MKNSVALFRTAKLLMWAGEKERPYYIFYFLLRSFVVWLLLSLDIRTCLPGTKLIIYRHVHMFSTVDCPSLYKICFQLNVSIYAYVCICVHVDICINISLIFSTAIIQGKKSFHLCTNEFYSTNIPVHEYLKPLFYIPNTTDLFS